MKNLIILISVIVFTNCNFKRIDISEYIVYKNDSIPIETKKQIKNLNDKIFDCISSGNTDTILNTIISDTLKKVGTNTIKSLFKQISLIYDKKDYVIKDEFYIPKSGNSQIIDIISDKGTNNEYSLKLKIGENDTYCSLLKFNNDALMISLIYGKKENKWELYFIGFKQYSYLGKLPYELYKTSLKNYKDGNIINAAIFSILSINILKPNKAFTYSKEEEIISNYNTIQNKINSLYIFPMTLDKIKTKPKIFQITYQFTNEGIFPMLNYLTEIPIKDTINLKTENLQIRKQVEQIFPNIKENNKYIYYTAHDHIPIQQEVLNVYGFVQEINNDTQ